MYIIHTYCSAKSMQKIFIQNMLQPRLIIFDFDGTLADTRKGILCTYHSVIAELDLPKKSDEELQSMIGFPLMDGFKRLFPDFSQIDIERITEYYRMVYSRDRNAMLTELFPGVVTTLRCLFRSGYTLAVASSRSTPSLIEQCESTDIAKYFAMIIGANDTERHKPDPQPVEHILESLHVSPGDAWVVGDMPVDIAMGRGAGSMTVGVTYGNSSAEALTQAGATMIIDHFSELLPLVLESNIVPAWADDTNCAITVCDADCTVIYMNEKAKATFASRGNLIGANLMDCHNENSRNIIRRLLDQGGTNCYTITKKGVRKMIYQSAWRKCGKVAGLVEISMVIPDELPHYDRG